MGNAGEVIIRSATAGDVPALKQVYWRAKSAHGYSAEEMAEFAAEVDLTLTEATVGSNTFAIAEIERRPVGFAGLLDLGEPDALHLEFLFIDPDAQGKGVGRGLFTWAVDEAGRRGYAAIAFQSDIHVTGFYERMGAIKVGERPSTVLPGAMIPSYRKNVI